MSTILIYDSNIENLQVMEQKLVDEGYSVKACNDVVESLKYAENNKSRVSMLITNYTIESFSLKDYLSVIRNLCANICVVVVSSSNCVDDEIRSINLGVDEFIRKPISTSIFVKRIERVYEFKKTPNTSVNIIRDDVCVDFINHRVYVNKKLASLTLREYQLLCYFIRKKSRVITREEIACDIWNQKLGDFNLRVIDVSVAKLRRKLGLSSLCSVRGLGYKMEL